MTKAEKLYIITLSLLLIITFSGLQTVNAQRNEIRDNVEKYSSLLQIINYYYVDSTNQSDLTETAIVSLLKELDPHSIYLSKKEVQKANEPLLGNFEGVGIQFQIYNDTILVISAVPGGPSDKLGIMAGDKIIKINNEDAFGEKVTNAFVMERLRGPKGTEVTIDILRNNTLPLIDYTIKRDKIPLNSIDATFMLNEDIGYIKLTRFARTSMDEMETAIASLKQQGMKDLILDLRNNSGGYLDIAVDLSDEFLPANRLIVYTEGLRSPRMEFRATNQGNFEQGKLIVLVNEGSASASEIVAGAVQDWDRGLIVGRRSFGKGLVQRPFTLPDSSMIRLTTARYYTPSGRSIQKSYEGGVEDYYEDLSNRYKHGEFVSADSIKFPDSLKYYTPSKRVVYGGGGIMPDVFIPLDTTASSPFYTDLWRKGVFNDFVLKYLESNRGKISREYKSFPDYKNNFNIDESILSQFLSFAATKGVTPGEDSMEKSGNEIKYIIKGIIARNLFDINSYFEIISPIDNELMHALNAMQQETLFTKLSFIR
ncbi:MAG TPA: S41 family peptidase [Lentimicrobium sp.]|nr:S41 family peptidase [Lentimicrobium sp.]